MSFLNLKFKNFVQNRHKRLKKFDRKIQPHLYFLKNFKKQSQKTFVKFFVCSFERCCRSPGRCSTAMCGLWPSPGTHSTHSHCPHTDPIDHRVLTSIGTKHCRLLYQLEPTADLLLALLVRICQLRRGGNVSVDLSLFAFTL